MAKQRNSDMAAWILSAPVITLLVILAILPSIQLLITGFQRADIAGPTLNNFEQLVDSKFAVQAFWRTLRVSVLTTVITVLGAYPMLYCLRRAGPRISALLLAITIFPIMVSTVVRAFGWNVILGPSGVINKSLSSLGLIDAPLKLIFNEFAIVVGETHLLFPYMVLALVAVMQKVDPALEEASLSLGANPLVTFMKVTLPSSYPGLLSGTLLVFSLAMTAFATPLLLGGARAPLLTTLLYSYAYTLYDWNRAAAVALILVAMAMAFYFLQRFISNIQMRSYGK